MGRRPAILGPLIGIVFALSLTAVRAGGPPVFVRQPCDLPKVTPSIAARLQCGTVSVPRDHGSDDAGTFRLAVVIVRPEKAPKEADPVLYLAGLGEPLTVRAAEILEHEAGVLAPDRDLILVDPRGTGRSEPLLCPDLALQQIAILAQGSERPALLSAWRASFGLCRVQMADDGVKPEWFGTLVTAEDMETVRRALGIERWAVYGLSYGTAAAMTMMALHPTQLETIVLDGVSPSDPPPLKLAQTFGHGLDMLFGACGADIACARAHPALATAYGEAARGLDARPLSVPLRPGLGIATFSLRGETFRLIVGRLLDTREGVAALPSFIEAARRRDGAAMGGAVEALARGYAVLSAGAMAAVACRDRTIWGRPGRPDDPPGGVLATAMCERWSKPGPPLPPARVSPVPILLLAGEADPVSPPAVARIAAGSLGVKAVVVEFAHVGQGVAASSPCGESLVTAFIRDPTAPVLSQCATRIAPVAFH